MENFKNLDTIIENVSGPIRTIDSFGRMPAIPADFRRALGIDYGGAEVRLILLNGALLLVPHKGKYLNEPEE